MLDSSSDYCTFSSQHAVDSFSIDFYVVMHSVCFVFPPCGRIHISMYRAVHIIRCVNCNKYQVFEKLTFRSHDLIWCCVCTRCTPRTTSRGLTLQNWKSDVAIWDRMNEREMHPIERVFLLLDSLMSILKRFTRELRTY